MAGPGVHDCPVKAVMSLCLSGVVVIGLSSCGNFNKPIDSSFNPLDSPGSARDVDVVDVSGPAYTPGQWLETTIPSTAFFSSLPSPNGNEQPDKTLPAGTVLKVISTEGTYVRVELESGDVGFVPSIMVAERPVAGELPIVPVGPDGVVPPNVPGIGGPAPDPEVEPLDAQPADGGPGVIDPGGVIE